MKIDLNGFSAGGSHDCRRGGPPTEAYISLTLKKVLGVGCPFCRYNQKVYLLTTYNNSMKDIGYRITSVWNVEGLKTPGPKTR